ncbi:helix-turn-helix domain-containing protein [bacterium]|nr:MAG: helix-turn-helix domain-containing protein [bacterium]
MRNDKEKALKLRLTGKSYTEIAQVLKIPKSTLSTWFKNLQLSKIASDRLNDKTKKGALKGLLKRNALQTKLAHAKAKKIRSAAMLEIGRLSNRELLLIGAALYWGEGHKRAIMKNGVARSYHPVSLSNSDPKLVAIFLEFLRKVCKIEENRLKAGLRIYQHQNPEQLLQFWSKLTKIPKERFEKFYYGVSKSTLNKRPYNVLPYGTIQVRIGDTATFHKIMGWIEGIAN